MRLPRSRSMRLSAEFLAVRKRGRSLGGRYLVLATLELDEPGPSKVGFVVSKRVGNAVARNLVKRRLHSIVGKFDSSLEPQRYIVTIARKGAAEQPFATLQKEWHRLAKRAHLLRATGTDTANPSASDKEAVSATN